MTKQELQNNWTNAFINLIMTETFGTDLTVSDEKSVIIAALNDTIDYLLSGYNFTD